MTTVWCLVGFIGQWGRYLQSTPKIRTRFARPWWLNYIFNRLIELLIGDRRQLLRIFRPGSGYLTNRSHVYTEDMQKFASNKSQNQYDVYISSEFRTRLIGSLIVDWIFWIVVIPPFIPSKNSSFPFPTELLISKPLCPNLAHPLNCLSTRIHFINKAKRQIEITSIRYHYD